MVWSGRADEGRMEQLRGIAVSPGIAVGRVFVLDDELLRIPRREVTAGAVPVELSRLERALDASVVELNVLRDRTGAGDERRRSSRSTSGCCDLADRRCGS